MSRRQEKTKNSEAKVTVPTMTSNLPAAKVKSKIEPTDAGRSDIASNSRSENKKSKSQKRKADTTDTTVTTADSNKVQPKGKKQKPSAPAEQNVTTRPEQTAYDPSIAAMDSTLLSDHFAQATRRHFSDSSSIEFEDKHLPSRFFSDTTSFSEPHVAKHLSTFLERFVEGGKEELSSSEELASPHTLVITVSGIRAADLARELRVFSSEDIRIAKLFAKHFKLKEHVDFVAKTKFGIGVGTPSRIRELLKQDALKVDKLQRIVIDGSYTDDKKRTIFKMSDCFRPLLEVLQLSQVRDRLKDESTSVVVF